MEILPVLRKSSTFFLPFLGVQGWLWHTAIAVGAPRSQRVLDALRCILSLIWDPFFWCSGPTARSPIIFFHGVRAQFFFSLIIRAQLFFQRISGHDYFFQFYTRPPPPPPGYLMPYFYCLLNVLNIFLDFEIIKTGLPFDRISCIFCITTLLFSLWSNIGQPLLLTIDRGHLQLGRAYAQYCDI